MTRSRPRTHAIRMTRRQAIGPAAIAAVIVIALVVVARALVAAGGRAPSASPGPSASGPTSPSARTATATARADRPTRPRPRAVRVRAVLGDERRDRRPPGEDPADDARAVLGHAHEDRQDRHLPDRLQADHRRHRQADDPRGARPGHRGPARRTRASGPRRNERFFGSQAVQDATIASLVALAAKIGVDGINVDVEQLADELVPAYGAFVGTAARGAPGEAARRTGVGRDDRRA